MALRWPTDSSRLPCGVIPSDALALVSEAGGPQLSCRLPLSRSPRDFHIAITTRRHLRRLPSQRLGYAGAEVSIISFSAPWVRPLEDVSLCRFRRWPRDPHKQHSPGLLHSSSVLLKRSIIAALGQEESGVRTAGSRNAKSTGADPESLRQVALGAKAATKVEEREATQLLRAAEAALGLIQKRAGGSTDENVSHPGWGQWGKWGKWGRWGWPSKEEAEQDKLDGTEDQDFESIPEGLLWNEKERQDIARSINSGQVEDAQQLIQLLNAKAVAIIAARTQQVKAGQASIVEKTGAAAPAAATPHLTPTDVIWLLEASLGARNLGLARSILNACRERKGSPGTQSNNSSADGSLQWPNMELIDLYCTYVTGLATLLRVSEAVGAVQEVRRRGLPQSDEVPFGHVVGCPTCQRPLTVVQPQYGRQLVPCATCRYEFELISGDLVSCESESLLEGPSLLDRTLRFLRLRRSGIPVAVHSVVMKLPNGTSEIRTFATATPSVPAQEGERLTLACAAPADSPASKRGLLGTLRLRTAARTPGWKASEPMQLDNHWTRQVLSLLRAPPKSARSGPLPQWLVPGALFLTANATAGAAFIDPSLPALLATTALSGAAATTAVTTFVAPRLNKLPEGSVASMSGRQQLLKQYAALEQRLETLTQASADEVRMLARMSQLQNKMEAVGEPSTYTARLERVVAARQGLQQRLEARLQLIDSYAKIAAMIEIEVEMEADVPTAEAAGAVASIADQIERLMEVESLQKEWQIQAEANDDVERLLRSAPPLPDA